MKKTKPKIIVILGQTSTGKSDLAIKLAKKIKGEIIGADSRQVYQGLDIGTSKITKKEMGGIPHYLIDVASPKKRFTVVEYQKMAREAINQILAKGRVPIIVGGTGFYIEALTNNISYLPTVINQSLRKKLASKKTKTLFEMLKKLDPQRASVIDPKNPRRLIRAIELAKHFGQVPILKKEPLPYKILKIGLKLHPEILKAKIKYKFLQVLDQGLIKEVQKLHQAGLSWKRLQEIGLHYAYVSLYLRKKIEYPKMIEGLSNAIWHYARRQWTWFKRDLEINWFIPTNKKDIKQIERLVKKFLK